MQGPSKRSKRWCQGPYLTKRRGDPSSEALMVLLEKERQRQRREGQVQLGGIRSETENETDQHGVQLWTRQSMAWSHGHSFKSLCRRMRAGREPASRTPHGTSLWVHASSRSAMSSSCGFKESLWYELPTSLFLYRYLHSMFLWLIMYLV